MSTDVFLFCDAVTECEENLDAGVLFLLHQPTAVGCTSESTFVRPVLLVRAGTSTNSKNPSQPINCVLLDAFCAYLATDRYIFKKPD
jgi:hypothetical protein